MGGGWENIDRLPDDAFRPVSEGLMVSCMDPRLSGGLAGASLTPALMLNYLRGDGASTLTDDLNRLRVRKLGVCLHEDCAAMATWLAALQRLLSGVKVFMDTSELYEALYDEKLVVLPDFRQRLKRWVTSLSHEGYDYVGDVKEVFSHIRKLEGQVDVPEGEAYASSLVYNTSAKGRQFVGHDRIRDTMVYRPFVVEAWLIDTLAKTLSSNSREYYEAAVVGRLFTLSVLSMRASPDMPIFLI